MEFRLEKKSFEWEKNLVCLLLQKVQGVSVNLEKQDRWVWKEGEKSGYMVKSGYLCLRGDSEEENDTVFKKLWKSKVVPSAQVTA